VGVNLGEGTVPEDWSQPEVEATVASYFDMLTAELRGEAYSKADHRRRLLHLLSNRTEGAVERKHGNISAILIELGFPYINGYKPYRNYQDLLYEVVSDRLVNTSQLIEIMDKDTERQVAVPTLDDILGALTDPPTPTPYHPKVSEQMRPYRTRSPLKTNYLEKEARNVALGLAGEEFVVRFEQARLIKERQPKLAEKVEHISLKHDGDGFDILSFDATGADRLIEVKTTKYGRETPFFVTPTEIEKSQNRRDDFFLYRVFQFREAKLFTLRGAISENFKLEPSAYIAQR